MSTRAEALAERIEQGAQALAAFAEGLSDAEWQTVVPGEGRTVGVLFHHVATNLLGESDLAKQLASGQGISDLTWAMVDQGNAQHAIEHARTTQREATELLRRNGAIAAAAIRELSDAELDLAAPNSLHGHAPVTTQFWIENHPLAHAYRHLESIRATLDADTRA
jgi:Mycothiol maleylpyruvate isomerase N-terminal domain